MPNLRGKTWTTSTPANVEDAQFWEDHLISNDDASKLENITGVPGGGSSGQVLTKTADGIGWRDPASSGHAIQNADGADMPYQGTLQFLGADVANDPENGKTVVDCHGQKGDAATIAAGTVTMLPAGSTPTVSNSGTPSEAVFDFGLPSSDGGVSSFNGRSGSILPMAGDYDSKKILLSSALHIGGETQSNVQEALEALENNKVDEVMYEEEIHGVNLLKNEATSMTNAGITYTVNSDGSITANGTATADSTCFIQGSGWNYNNTIENFLEQGETYILSDGVNSYTGDKNVPNIRMYGYTSAGTAWSHGEITPNTHKEFTVDATMKSCHISVYIRVPNGQTVNNLVFKPMLRKADIEDSTYRPYNPQAIQNQLNAQGVLGAKNLLENKLSSKTKSGITVTVNSNKSVALSGTNSSSSATGFVLSNENDALGTQYATPFKAGESYIFSGGGTGDPYDLQLLYKNGTYKKPTPNKPFILEADVACVYFSVAGNATVNATVYPMIRLASDPDDTYQPYAMTNRELTEEKINIADLKTVVSASSDFADFKTRIASL